MQKNDFKGQDLSNIFKGKDLRGSGDKFKNQDLTGADFSDCDLRGVDFSFADLTDAKFCNARMGREPKINSSISMLAVFLAAVTLFITVMGANTVQQILTSLGSYNNLTLNVFLISYTFIFIACILASVNYNRFGYLYVYFYLITFISFISGIFVNENTMLFGFYVIVASALTGIGSVVANVVIINHDQEQSKLLLIFN